MTAKSEDSSPVEGQSARGAYEPVNVNEGYPWLDVGDCRTWDQINVGDEVRWVNGYADWERVVSIQPILLVRLSNGQTHHMRAEYTSVVKTTGKGDS